MADRAKLLRWPYTPRLAATTGVALVHSGGSAVAWVRIVANDEHVTSVDPSLISEQRVLLEQRESA